MGKTAVIAGGSAGIGRATARMLADRGYNIVVLARGAERLADAEVELRRKGVEAMAIQCDVADADAMMAAADATVERFGSLDVWINCAMLTIFAPFERISPDEFQRIMDVTFIGQVNGTRAALAHMKRAGHGSIVNISSGLSYRSVPLQSAYCAAKHAVNGFTSSIRSELIHDGYDGITISLAQLPAVNTPQFSWARNRLDRAPRPAPPAYQPEVVAQGIWKAIRDGSREVVIGSSVAQLMFGQMAAPNYLDHKMASAGYDGQKSDEPARSDHSGNLFEPSDLDVAAHGEFDDEAKSSGLVIDGDVMRRGVFGGLALLGLGAGYLAGRFSGSRRHGRLAHGRSSAALDQRDDLAAPAVIERRRL